MVFLAPVFNKDSIPDKERISTEYIATQIKLNFSKEASAFNDYTALQNAIIDSVKKNDVLVFMSSGDMSGLPQNLIKILNNNV